MAALRLRALDLLADVLSRAISVADRFPNLTVRGVDLYPPPQSHVPPNCIFEVDDFTSEWYYPSFLSPLPRAIHSIYTLSS